MTPDLVVMFVYNTAVHDSRVWREARSLRGIGYDVSVIALEGGELPARERRYGIQVVRVGGGRGVRPGDASPFRTGRGAQARIRWLWGYWRHLAGWRDEASRAAEELSGGRPAIWHGHDLTGLLAASQARRRLGGVVVYDSHELYVESGSVGRLPRPAKWLVRALEDRLARRAQGVITVNDSIARELAARFGAAVTVVMNCVDVEPEPRDRLTSPLRTTFGLGTRPVILYHGGVGEGRGIRTVVQAMMALPDDVAFVVLGDGELTPVLRDLAMGPGLKGRLFLHQAVPIDDLPDWIAGADAGVIAFQPIDRNNLLGTPNKLFECLAAGVPVIVSDLPEMGRIVREIDAGFTCDPARPESVAAAVRALIEEGPPGREARRRRCHLAARTRYNWEHEFAKLRSLYQLALAP